MPNLQPYTLRDFRQGRYTINQVAPYLAPENSVKDSLNVDFDAIVGSGKVRSGQTLLGSAVASGKDCLGFGEFVGHNGSPNLLLAVFKGASNATLYYFDTSWHASNLTALSNSAVCSFEVLGGRAFVTNTTDGMYSSSDGATWSSGTTNDCIASASAKPSLLFRSSGRLLAAGDPTYPDRVFFSSIIDPSSAPFITWNVDATSGDWIDINPDDGQNITGFNEASTFVLPFKNYAMYRLDTVNKTADPNLIFDVGATSQRAIVGCQGVVYMFTGIDIRRTNGGYPEQISRAGVQDIIEAIPQSSWSTVAAGTDGLNVYFSVGNVTLNTNQDTQKTISNCVLKYSPRDQSWSVRSYPTTIRFFAQLTTSSGRLLRAADSTGNVFTMNSGTTDNGTVINYFLETQDLEFGDRSHLHQIADQIAFFTSNAAESKMQVRENGSVDLVSVNVSLDQRVNISSDINIKAFFFNFRWYGESSGTSPVFEGFKIERITDLGMTSA